MKYFILLALLSTTAFASEKEGEDTCTSLRNRRDRIVREQSQLSREFIAKEEEDSWYVSPEPESFNCEEVPDARRTYLKRYDALSRDKAQIDKEIERYCPRSYPE